MVEIPRDEQVSRYYKPILNDSSAWMLGASCIFIYPRLILCSCDRSLQLSSKAPSPRISFDYNLLLRRDPAFRFRLGIYEIYDDLDLILATSISGDDKRQ